MNGVCAGFYLQRIRQHQPLQEGKARFHFMHDEPLFRSLLYLCSLLISQKRKLTNTRVQEKEKGWRLGNWILIQEMISVCYLRFETMRTPGIKPTVCLGFTWRQHFFAPTKWFTELTTKKPDNSLTPIVPSGNCTIYQLKKKVSVFFSWQAFRFHLKFLM